MVCLGATGRNFAAGMSGGIAYVYDPTAEFPARCNMGMVALLSVEDSAEAARLKGHLEEHVKYTDSAVAKRLLADWSTSVGHFVKVCANTMFLLQLLLSLLLLILLVLLVLLYLASRTLIKRTAASDTATALLLRTGSATVCTSVCLINTLFCPFTAST
jgi:glutamate synthase domain-containing protein 3